MDVQGGEVVMSTQDGEQRRPPSPMCRLSFRLRNAEGSHTPPAPLTLTTPFCKISLDGWDVSTLGRGGGKGSEEGLCCPVHCTFRSALVTSGGGLHQRLEIGSVADSNDGQGLAGSGSFFDAQVREVGL